MSENPNSTDGNNRKRLQHTLDCVSNKLLEIYKGRLGLSHIHVAAWDDKHLTVAISFDSDSKMKEYQENKASIENEMRKTILDSIRHNRIDLSNIKIDFLLFSQNPMPDKCRNIPSDEEFEQASRMMENAFRGLEIVEKRVMERFGNECRLVHFFILPGRNDREFHAYIFFKGNSDVKACKAQGIVDDIVDFVYEQLEDIGRGNRKNIRVLFEVDSDENVRKNYEGDYYLRLR